MSTLRVRVAGRLSRFGEHRGWDWLVYNPIHFLHFHDYAVTDAPAVLDGMEAVFPCASSYADVGAGSGAYAAEATRRGHPTVAYERDRFGRFLARRQGVHALPFDLTSPPSPPRCDLAFCFEVAEHVPPDLGDALVAFLAATAKEILFTAAPPGQGGTGHINEQPMAYWETRFALHGKRLDQERTVAMRSALGNAHLRSHWLHRNATVFA